jgi:glycerate kinase
VATRAASQRVPATLISGSVDRTALSNVGRHFAGCFSLPFAPSSLEQCLAGATGLLTDRAEQVARLFEAVRR